jgi:hypothetical protein
MSVKDVYAGDADAAQSPATTSVLFVVVADPDPDVLCRVATHVRLGNVAPSAGALATRADGAIVIRIQVDGLAMSTAEGIRRKLLQLTTVWDVEMHCAEALRQPSDRPRDSQ